jgi:2'-5' RNA ligase
MRLPRLFVAVWPTDAACADLAMLPRKDQPGVRFVAEENWHVTLRFLGDAHPREVAEALDEVTFPSDAVRLGPVVEYLGGHSLIVHATGCETLNRLVERATAGLGDAPVRHRFVGHLTLARLGRRARRPPIVGMAFSSSFVATEVVLAQSHLEPGGARYEVIARWPTT